MLLPLAGCSHGLPLESDPYTTPATLQDTVVLNANDLSQINALTATSISNPGDPTGRNNFLSLKMYLIDKAYFDYERRLTNEDVSINTIGSIGTLASTAVATAIPAGQTTKALAAVATGLNGATSIYDEKVLLTKTIQALQQQMRTDRDTVAAKIYSRRGCSLTDYDMGMALSDLEAYARAGTYEAALQGLSKTVSQAQVAAADSKTAALEGVVPPTNLTMQATKVASDIKSTTPAGAASDVGPTTQACPLLKVSR